MDDTQIIEYFFARSEQAIRYTFDETGALTGQEDTGETVPYRR